MKKYTELAEEQLDGIEDTPGFAKLYNAILDVCDLIFENSNESRSKSRVLDTIDGKQFFISVPKHYPYKVFWSYDSDELPVVEAILKYS